MKDERSQIADLCRRLRQYEGRPFETTICYNGMRDEAAGIIEALAGRSSPSQVAPANPVQVTDDSPASLVNGIANEIHNLARERQYDEALLERLGDFRSRLWAVAPTIGAGGQAVAGDGSMTAEEIRLEDLKQMAAYAGPIVSLEAKEPYYLASCNHCGWVGSSELCGTDSFGDDSDVYCPRCHASGADCGKVRRRPLPTPSRR